MPLIAGKTLADSKLELENKMVSALIMNYKVWPLVQYLNFRYVPCRLQVLWVNTFGLFFNVYLSWVTYVFKGKDDVKL